MQKRSILSRQQAKESSKIMLGSKQARERLPQEIVDELNKHIVSQAEAKKAVAIALRNRYRRRRVKGAIKEEIYPRNILMIGNTGVGKTEIARRLAKLAGAPFIKVEATKFTEVGYVGRDVESMVRDLVEVAVDEEKRQFMEKVRPLTKEHVEELLLDALLPESKGMRKPTSVFTQEDSSFSISLSLNSRRHQQEQGSMSKEELLKKRETLWNSREKLRQKLRGKLLEEKHIEIEVPANNVSEGGQFSMFPFSGSELPPNESMGTVMKNMMKMFSQREKAQELTVKNARVILEERVSENLVDTEKVVANAKEQVETMGILFIDEIDKIVSPKGSERIGADVSRQGVQRDILPLVEGSSVNTRYGVVKTDHILFIASGAFHVASPADMIPELQGRFPIRVKLEALVASDLRRILVEPEAALTKQYAALLETEGLLLKFSEDALDAISEAAMTVNTRSEDIGARRLFTLMEKLLEEILFKPPVSGLSKKTFTVTKKYTQERLKDILPNDDLSKYLL